MPACRPQNFANPDVDTQTWYVAARSSDVRTGKIKTHRLLHRNIILYRDSAGVAHAMDAQCPHLGADLGQGKLISDEVQCAFHHWRFGPDGRCRSAPNHTSTPSRCVRAYPTEERWGLLWLFNGPRASFPLPSPPDAGRYRIVRTPSQIIRCHPHLVVGNGLDTAHLGTLHEMDFTAPPHWSAGAPFTVTSTVQGRPRAAWLRWVTGSSREDIVATFSALGGNLAWATVSQPVRFHALFTGQPDAGGCRTQVVLFLPATFDTKPLRAVALLLFILKNDRRVLERLQFVPAYAEGDECLRSLAEVVNSMPVW